MNMSRSKRLFLIVSVLVAILGAGSQKAYALGTPAIGYDTYTGGSGFLNGFTVGWEFTTSTNLYITHLGYYDYVNDGLADSHDVGIYNLSGTLLVSATVAAGTGELLLGDNTLSKYRYHDLPVDYLLPAGTYRLAGVGSPSDAAHATPFPLYTAPAITLGNSYFVFTGGSSLSYPTSLGGGPTEPYSGPNFIFDIPEPSAVTLLGLSGMILLCRRRR